MRGLSPLTNQAESESGLLPDKSLNKDRPDVYVESGITQETYMNRRIALAAALTAGMAAPALLSAQAPVEAPTFQAEKCYGIARAGGNDCASTGNNSCGGTSRINGDPNAWIYVPAGYCERIVGGNLTAQN